VPKKKLQFFSLDQKFLKSDFQLLKLSIYSAKIGSSYFGTRLEVFKLIELVPVANF
jgi:hypothetical protein